MKVPQIIMICLTMVFLLWNAYQHGKPRAGRGNFWYALGAAVIQFSLLLAGGFFASGGGAI